MGLQPFPEELSVGTAVDPSSVGLFRHVCRTPRGPKHADEMPAILGGTGAPSGMNVPLEPENVTLSGNRVFANVVV